MRSADSQDGQPIPGDQRAFQQPANGLDHNPTIGGHVAITVPDIDVVKRRLDAAGIQYSDAGRYAMVGFHQIYLYDPSMNLIEVNQRVG